MIKLYDTGYHRLDHEGAEDDEEPAFNSGGDFTDFTTIHTRIPRVLADIGMLCDMILVKMIL